MSPRVRCTRVASRASTTDERGFTLIELMIVTVIVPIIIGALSVSLISVFSLQSSVSTRLGDSANSQVLTNNFSTDVQRSVWITTSPTLSQCGTGTQLLGIVLGSGEFVSYSEVPATTPYYDLVRNLCSPSTAPTTTAPTTTPGVPGALETSTTLAYNVENLAVTATQWLSGVSTVLTSVPTWTSTNGISDVNLTVTAKSNLNYNVAAEPLGADSTTTGLGTTATQNTCGFALPGTGTYARTLCFFDFASYIPAGAIAVSNVPIHEYVPGGYLFTANLTISTSSSTVQPVKFPTYSAAFLGNAIGGTPFYTGVGCPTTDTATVTQDGNVLGQPSCISPAIYMYSQGGTGTATVTLSNITLTTSTGAFVTGYGIVTADAETTDANPESIKWTSNVDFNQVPDTPTSPEGNACSLVNSNGTATGGGTDLTPNPILNTTTVTCNDAYQEPSSQPRTGTVVLDVSPPANGAPTGNGNGLTWVSALLSSAGGKQAVSFGLLLP